MKRSLFFFAFTIFSAAAQAAPQTLAGSVNLNVAGIFRTPLSAAILPAPTGVCTGIVALVPTDVSTTLSTLTLLTLFAGGGSEQASKPMTINAARNGFSCLVSVPYRWENVDPATTKMAIAYTVKASDPGGFTCSPPTPACIVAGTSPGKKQQLLKIVPLPANGTVTNVSTLPAL